VRRVGQHHCNAYRNSELRLGLAAAGSEPAVAQGEAFALQSNSTAAATVVGETDPGRSGGPGYHLEDSTGSSSCEGLD